MTTTETKTHWTAMEFRAEAHARFGEDRLKLAFECPSCRDVATLADFLAVVDQAEAERTFGQNCIGRYMGALDGDGPTEDAGRSRAVRGCNWTAYGLIRGPWFIDMPDGREIASFPFASGATA